MSDEQGAALYCGNNREGASYGDGGLILEGYRVDYIGETITGRE
jgi:hypothetical protein